MKKLIAIDLDGTTLNNQSIITKETEQTLKKAIASGHYVSIATGRPYRISQHFYQQLELNTPMVNFNGALVHIPEKQWLESNESTVHRDLVFDILAQKEALNIIFIAAEDKETFYIDTFDHFEPTFFSAEMTEQNLLTTKNLTTHPNSIMIRTQQNQTEPVANFLKTNYGNSIDVRTWGGPMPILEIVAKGIHKAKGVKQIADYLEIDRSNIIAFGDEHNDTEMLDYAGWGVAMKNATPTLKAIANDITENDNHNNGLAHYLKNYLNL